MGLETIAAVVSAAVGVAGAVNASRQASAQDAAQKKAEKAADEATNRANQKSPDTLALLDAAQQAGKAGPSGTMLTGAQGIDPAQLNLGKSTLLGQ